MIKVICVYDENCEFKGKELECSFEDSCNQQAKPYVLNGVIYWLRRSDLIMFTLTKTISETIINNKKRLTI